MRLAPHSLNFGGGGYEIIMNRFHANIFLFLITSSISIGANATTTHPSHCKENEEIFFSCVSESKVISVCASPDASAIHGHLTYRFGRIDQPVELEYPSTSIPPGNAFKFAREQGHPKGGSEQLAFSVGRFTYTIYSYHWSTAADPQWESGVLVESDGKDVAIIRCTDPEGQLVMYYLGDDSLHISNKHFVGLPSDEIRYDVP